jgi:hypothetical protein
MGARSDQIRGSQPRERARDRLGSLTSGRSAGLGGGGGSVAGVGLGLQSAGGRK